MWQRDFPGTYENLKKDWSDGLQPIMDAILGNSFYTCNYIAISMILCVCVCVRVWSLVHACVCVRLKKTDYVLVR